MSVFKDFPGLENLEKKIPGLSRTCKSPVKRFVKATMLALDICSPTC